MTDKSTSAITEENTVDDIPNLKINLDPVLSSDIEPDGNGTSAEINQIYLATYDEYLKFIEENSLEGVIVPYEDIKAIGEFRGLLFYHPAEEKDFSKYMYSLVDSSGTRLSLTIEDLKTAKRLTETVIGKKSVTTDNMRTIAPIEGIAIYTTEDGVEYTYRKTDLYTIAWHSDRLRYKLWPADPREISTYPLNTDTFVSRLLNTETAAAAITQLKDSLAVQKPTAEKE